ncbi:MAG: hypothetical protein GY797_18960, partial [Deltaproteobacteria bacterium]|nr:hypothetical protein [Deltaproteobacteria bacterium]
MPQHTISNSSVETHQPAAQNILAGITPETIEYVWHKIVDSINPVKIIMFGSQAEGRAD